MATTAILSALAEEQQGLNVSVQGKSINAIRAFTGEGVLVFSDIYGATPCNLASKLLVPGHVEVVAGVNLPMLVKTLAYRALPIEQVLARAKDAGEQGQIDIKEEMAHAAAGRS